LAPVNTSFVTIYYEADTYDVTAGLGPFNASYVAPFLDKLQSVSPQYRSSVVPYSFTAISYNLVANQMYTTVCEPEQCKGDSCRAYLMSGGLMMLTPWIPASYPSYPLVMVRDVPSVQIEFLHSPPNQKEFSDADCDVFGAPGVLIGVRLCLRTAESNPGFVDVGEFRHPSIHPFF
jgi:hypothetical protein